MMLPVIRVKGNPASACEGAPHLDGFKLIWNGGMIATSFLAPIVWSWPAILTFVVLTYLTMLLGHSIGMHRMMIHRTLRLPMLLARLLIYFGVLVGMGGPSRIIGVHDLRDWAQRLPDCHDFFSHRRGFWRDLSWQLFYRFEFRSRPEIIIESEIADDPFYRFLDRTWPLHILSLAAVFYIIGGWPMVIWCVSLRCALSVVGHWTITYICHNPGPGRWRVEGAGVQASNLRFMAFLTHGECWHNNHHAFPESARIGLDPGQWDPAWVVIRILEQLGIAKDVKRPRSENQRDDLIEA